MSVVSIMICGRVLKSLSESDVGAWTRTTVMLNEAARRRMDTRPMLNGQHPITEFLLTWIPTPYDMFVQFSTVENSIFIIH